MVPEPGEPITLGKGDAILVDKIAAVPIRVQSGEAQRGAILMDIEGRFNKSSERAWGRFLFAPGQSAELIAELILAEWRVNPEAGEQMLTFVQQKIREG